MKQIKHKVYRNGKKISAADLKIGDKVSVLTAFGRFNMWIDKMELDGGATALSKNKKMGAWLYCSDGYWDSDVSFDPEAIVKVELV